MKERPILFSGEMVRAILEGRKTQTRRVASLARMAWILAGRRIPGFGWLSSEKRRGTDEKA
jgi:hypothetical protein